MSESLKAKTVKGVGWSFADNLANSGITFLVGLVLARLLTPSEYGMLATIMIFIAVANSIVDSGFSNALICKIDARSVDYNTVFYFNHTNPPSLRENEPECQKIVIIRFSQM